MKSGFTTLCLVLFALIVCWAVACETIIAPVVGGGGVMAADQNGRDSQPLGAAASTPTAGSAAYSRIAPADEAGPHTALSAG